jgi:ATP-binding protein involved in chromosome partitioning
MIDPRPSVLDKRFSSIGRIVGFSSAKGGVGKSTCASIAGAVLSRSGRRVGLLDCDLQGASAHVFLGVAPHLPLEDQGILPVPVADSLWLMSAALFVGHAALSLRGQDVTDALLELLAVTRWGVLDYLLIDLPPGMGDELLDLIRLVPRMEVLAISTPEKVSISVVEKMMWLLRETRVPVIGVIANMVRGNAAPVREMASRTGAAFIGELPFDPDLEPAVGDTLRLLRTSTAEALQRLLAGAGVA